MYYVMYYITFKVAIPVSGLGIIRIFNLIYIIIVFYACRLRFDPPRIYLHDGGTDLFSLPDPFYRYFWSGGSIYWSPGPFYGDRIPRDTGEMKAQAQLI